MGTWGAGTFENDTACDWAEELEFADDLSRVADAIQRVLEAGGEYLDADDAAEALAACEVVARLRGNWGRRDAYTEGVDRWVEAHPGPPPPELVAEALAAIDRIATPPSELLELWEESEDSPEWHEALRDLRARVAG